MLPDVKIEPATVRILGGLASDRATEPGTQELFLRHSNHTPKRFDSGIEYKPIDRTLQFHYQLEQVPGPARTPQAGAIS